MVETELERGARLLEERLVAMEGKLRWLLERAEAAEKRLATLEAGHRGHYDVIQRHDERLLRLEEIRERHAGRLNALEAARKPDPQWREMTPPIATPADWQYVKANAELIRECGAAPAILHSEVRAALDRILDAAVTFGAPR